MLLGFRQVDLFSSVASHSGFFSILQEIPRPYKKGPIKRHIRIDPRIQHPDFVRIFGKDIRHWRAHDPMSMIESLKDGELSIYFDVGTDDEIGFYDHARYFHDRLAEIGITHTFKAVPGTHHERLWKERINGTSTCCSAIVYGHIPITRRRIRI